MTAVETLLDWLAKNHYYIGNDLLEKVEELKQMEKQQIMESFNFGVCDGGGIIKKYKMSGEKYYNETFKTN